MLLLESCVLPQRHTQVLVPPTPGFWDPWSRINFNHPLFFLPFFDVTFWLQSSSIFNPTWPHLGPQVGLYKPIFCPSFSDHLSNSISDLILDRFRTPNRFQNRSKINQKMFQNQSTNKFYFSFIFNQISKTISCSSKMVDFRKSFQNLMFLHVI